MNIAENTITHQNDLLQRISAAAGAIGMASGFGAVAYFDPATAGFFPICPFYTLTGFACPGCGLTRAFHSLFHGDVLQSLDYNALFPFFAFVIGYFFVSLVLSAVRGRGLSFRIFHPKLIFVFLIVGLVFGVVRNIPAYPFSVLYP
jgi:hypothetical protein